MSKELDAKMLGRLPFIYRFPFSFLLCVFFALLFFVFYLIYFPQAIESTAKMSPQLLGYVHLYGKFVPVALAILAFLWAMLLFLLRFIVRLHRAKVVVPLMYLVLFGAFAFFGATLLYQEPRNTDVAIIIIDFFGKPFFYAGGIVAGVCVVWFLAALIDSLFKTGRE